MAAAPRYPGIRVTANGNQLVSYHTETRIADAGVFYPITPSTEGGELYQQSFAEGRLNVFGRSTLAVEAEGEHAAQGGAIAHSVCGKRVVNFTSGQGILYGVEQYYHAPGKCSTMVLEVVARALTKHALNVHCGHDDVYGALDTGWIILFGKDAQQAADHALILRRVTELSLTPGMNVQDGFLTSHLERTFYKHESELIREYLGAPDDIIDCPTESQRILFGPKRRRVPQMIDLTNPVLLGPVQNQEHYMQGVAARRNNFTEPILQFLEEAYAEFGKLTGRYYGLITQYKTDDAETVFVSLGSAAENIEAAVDYLRARRGAKVGSIHLNVIRPFPEAAVVKALAGKRNVIVLERTDEPMAGDNPMGRDIRTALNKALQTDGHPATAGLPAITAEPDASAFLRYLWPGVAGFPARAHLRRIRICHWHLRPQRRQARATDGTSFFVLGVDHPYEVKSDETPSLLPEGRGRRSLPLHRRLGSDHDGQEPRRHSRRSERPALRARQDRRRAGQSQRDHSRQCQSQVRIGEERRPHGVFHGGSAGADSRQLRPSTRHRRAVLRSEGVHAYQPARRNVRGRLLWCGNPKRKASRPGSGYRFGHASRSSTRKSAFSPCQGSRSRARRPIVPTFNFACRATLSWAHSSQSLRFFPSSASPRNSSTKSFADNT